MKQHILCLTDFSEASASAVIHATHLAEQLNAHLTVLYAYRLNQSTGKESMIEHKKLMDQAAQVKFRKIEEDVLTKAKISYDVKSEIGFLSDRVEDYAQKNNISYLVVAASAEYASENCSSLAESLRVPLLIVPRA